jgi:MFS family permease
MFSSTREHPGLLLATLLTGQTMASMDGSIVNVALPSIQRDLGANGAALQLIVSGYLLALGVLIVTGARLGDLLGHRRTFLWGLGGFTAASLLCGVAPTAPALVVARVVQAGAAALLIPQVFSLVQLRFAGAALRRAIGLYSMVLALGVALGQILGGLVVGADLFGLSWRPAFLINVPVGVVLVLTGLRTLPRAPRVRRRLDITGVVLLSAAMAAVVAPLVFGREYGWRPWTWASLVAGLALLAAFAGWERLLARRGGLPLLDLSVLRPRGVPSGLLTCVLVMGCYAAFLFAFTLNLQERHGIGPLGAGLTFVPFAIGFATVSLTWAKLRVHAWLPVAGPLAFAVVAAVIGAFGWSYALLPLLVVAGAGHAAGYSPMIARLSAAAGPERASALSALNSTGPMLASVTAVAGLGSVYLTAGLGWTFTLVAALLVLSAASALRATVTLSVPAEPGVGDAVRPPADEAAIAT